MRTNTRKIGRERGKGSLQEDAESGRKDDSCAPATK